MADGLKDNLKPVLAMSKEFSSLGFVLVACNWRDLEFHDMSLYLETESSITNINRS